MDITLYPDEDWTVDSTTSADSCSITFTGPDGSEVRFEASYGILSELGERWVKEYGGVTSHGHEPGCWATPVEDRPPGAHHHVDDCNCGAGLGRNPDEIAMKLADVGPHFVSPTLDAIDAKIDNLEALLTEHRKGEERRYPDDFQPGDWVRFPPKKTWRKIDRVAANISGTNRVVWFTYGGKEYGQDARPETRYPYMTAAVMAAVPKQEA
jgi:hypothetical protein